MGLKSAKGGLMLWHLWLEVKGDKWMKMVNGGEKYFQVVPGNILKNPREFLFCGGTADGKISFIGRLYNSKSFC